MNNRSSVVAWPWPIWTHLDVTFTHSLRFVQWEALLSELSVFWEKADLWIASAVGSIDAREHEQGCCMKCCGWEECFLIHHDTSVCFKPDTAPIKSANKQINPDLSKALCYIKTKNFKLRHSKTVIHAMRQSLICNCSKNALKHSSMNSHWMLSELLLKHSLKALWQFESLKACKLSEGFTNIMDGQTGWLIDLLFGARNCSNSSHLNLKNSHWMLSEHSLTLSEGFLTAW